MTITHKNKESKIKEMGILSSYGKLLDPRNKYFHIHFLGKYLESAIFCHDFSHFPSSHDADGLHLPAAGGTAIQYVSGEGGTGGR